MKTPNLKYFRVTILIFRGLVTSSERDHRTRQEHFPISGQWWPCVYLARIWRYGASKILGSRVWPSGVTWRHRSHDHLTRHNVVSYWWSIVNMHLSWTVTEIWGSKDIGVTTLTLVTTLTFWGHVTSSVTWPSDSAWALSYWWSVMTMRVSCTETKIRGFKDFGVTSLTFWGHVTSSTNISSLLSSDLQVFRNNSGIATTTLYYRLHCTGSPSETYSYLNNYLSLMVVQSSQRNASVYWM